MTVERPFEIIAVALPDRITPGSSFSFRPPEASHRRLTLSINAVYLCEFDPKKKRADSVSARGVTILSGGSFSLLALGNRSLPAGTTFTVIKNTSRSPIAGTFSNLPESGILAGGGNNFQASYSGGDGNDLTLTVVP